MTVIFIVDSFLNNINVSAPNSAVIYQPVPRICSLGVLSCRLGLNRLVHRIWAAQFNFPRAQHFAFKKMLGQR